MLRTESCKSQSIGFPVRRLIALGTMLVTLHVPAVISVGSASERKNISGRMTSTGHVTIDDIVVTSSQTVFSGTRITTAPISQSVIYLDPGRLHLNSESELLLEFSSSSVSATLNRGVLTVFVPIGASATIATNHTSITTDPCEPAILSIHATSTDTNVTVETGRVEAVSHGTHTSVKGGDSFSATHQQLVMNPQEDQNLNGNRLGWVIGGIGAGVGIILVAILGRPNDSEGDFGGCVIVSDSRDSPPTCP